MTNLEKQMLFRIQMAVEEAIWQLLDTEMYSPEQEQMQEDIEKRLRACIEDLEKLREDKMYD